MDIILVIKALQHKLLSAEGLYPGPTAGVDPQGGAQLGAFM